MDYAARRKKLIEHMGEDAALVLFAPPARLRSRDTDYPYRPGSDLLYLCGFPEPGTVLVLTPGHPDHELVLSACATTTTRSSVRVRSPSSTSLRQSSRWRSESRTC